MPQAWSNIKLTQLSDTILQQIGFLLVQVIFFTATVPWLWMYKICLKYITHFCLFTDWCTLQCVIAAAFLIRVPLKHRLYWATQDKGSWLVVVLYTLSFTCGKFVLFATDCSLHLQDKRTTSTGLNIWWRVKTSTQDNTLTPLWVNCNRILSLTQIATVHLHIALL